MVCRPSGGYYKWDEDQYTMREKDVLEKHGSDENRSKKKPTTSWDEDIPAPGTI